MEDGSVFCENLPYYLSFKLSTVFVVWKTHKLVWVKFLKHWYKQVLKETSFLLWFLCIWYRQTIFPLQGQQFKLYTKWRPEQYSNKLLSVGSYIFIHTFIRFIQVVFFQLYLMLQGPLSNLKGMAAHSCKDIFLQYCNTTAKSGSCFQSTSLSSMCTHQI